MVKHRISIRRWKRTVRTAMAWLLALGGLGVLTTAIIVIGQLPIPEDARYIGSAACDDCHWRVYGGWADSLHPKMMRRVEGDGVVVADFSSPDLPFDPQDAVWAIGSRFAQQFMGHDGTTETLLPGAWHVDPDSPQGGHWQTKGWDGWNAPVPLQRCHGCHTVGLDVETGHFVEPGIGCESCHGPGSWHLRTLGFGAIASTLDADACGQCHSRGLAIDGKHFFPVGYRIGDPLADHFRESRPLIGQNSAEWWGNGRERKRHQEYGAWKQGGHADSLKSLTDRYDGRYGEVTSACLRCHAAEAAANPRRDYRLAEVRHGITCAVCHNVHGALDQQRFNCNDCHEQGAYYHAPERNAEHVVCGKGVDVTCVDCHMPLTAKNGSGLNLHSHHPGIIPPSDTDLYGVPSSCANGGCHADRESEWLQAALRDHYCAEKERADCP
jgi:hypothetical protein